MYKSLHFLHRSWFISATKSPFSIKYNETINNNALHEVGHSSQFLTGGNEWGDFCISIRKKHLRCNYF